MKEQKSVRSKDYYKRFVGIYVATAILCLLIALAVSLVVLKLTNGNTPMVPPTIPPTASLPTDATPPDSTVPSTGVATPTVTPKPTTPEIDPGKINMITMTEAQSKLGNLVLVNKDHTFDPNTVTKELVIIRETPGRTIVVTDWFDKVTYDMFLALCNMQTAMEKEIDAKNMQLCTTEPYIPTIQDENDPTVMLPNNTSEHATGLASNLKFHERGGSPYNFSASQVSELYSWMQDNAWRFGLVFRYPASKNSVTNHQAESSHLRYVGAVHAEYMYRHDLCLEEYLELLKGYNFNKPLTFEASDGNTYYLYHISAAESGDTSVPTRKDVGTEKYADAQISGTNMGGFVVLQQVISK